MQGRGAVVVAQRPSARSERIVPKHLWEENRSRAGFARAEVRPGEVGRPVECRRRVPSPAGCDRLHPTQSSIAGSLVSVMRTVRRRQQRPLCAIDLGQAQDGSEARIGPDDSAAVVMMVGGLAGVGREGAAAAAAAAAAATTTAVAAASSTVLVAANGRAWARGGRGWALGGGTCS